MKEIAQCIVDIKNTSGRNDKISLLEKYASVEGFKEVMQFVFNPYVRTGIGAAKLKKAAGTEYKPISYKEAINFFTLNSTGSDVAADFAKDFVNQFEDDLQTKEVAKDVVTKNLKIGVTAKTLNKVYGKTFIPMIGCMFAEKYEEQKHKVKGPFIVTEKLDGARRILVKDNGNITLYSRSGIPDEGLVEIEAEAKYLPDGAVYDGELLAKGDFDNAIELRQATNSIANSKGERTGLTFNVFDFISVDDFKVGKSRHSATARKAAVAALFKDDSIKHLVKSDPEGVTDMFNIDYDFKHIVGVPVLGIANTEEEVNAFAEPIWQRGFEGVMLNTLDGLYEVDKRVKTILKVKNVLELTVPVTGIEEGKNKNQGKVGALIVNYKGYSVGVGSGLTDKERQDFFDNPELIVGKQIEIDCFGESTNKNGGLSLNCPIYKRVVK